MRKTCVKHPELLGRRYVSGQCPACVKAQRRKSRSTIEGAVAALVGAAKARAKRGGRVFCITADDLKPFPAVCPFLGLELVYGGHPRTDGSASIDRINPRWGYTPGNVMLVSWRANEIKKDATLAELAKIGKFAEALENGMKLQVFTAPMPQVAPRGILGQGASAPNAPDAFRLGAVGAGGEGRTCETLQG